MTRKITRSRPGEGPLVRASVAVPEDLLTEFDRHVGDEGRENRSEAVRSLMRRHIAEERWRGEGEVYGTVTLVYDHHVPDLAQKLIDAQHDHGEVVLCSAHAHVAHDLCIECVIVSGAASKIQDLCDALRGIRGLESVETAISSGARHASGASDLP